MQNDDLRVSSFSCSIIDIPYTVSCGTYIGLLGGRETIYVGVIKHFAFARFPALILMIVHIE